MYIYVEEECSAPSCTLANEAINNVDSVVYGGDDGARTRDLCRDRTDGSGNLLKLRGTNGYERQVERRYRTFREWNITSNWTKIGP
jgi:hypothetical protein